MSQSGRQPPVGKVSAVHCWRCRVLLAPPAYHCEWCNAGLKFTQPALTEAEFVERYRDGAVDE